MTKLEHSEFSVAAPERAAHRHGQVQVMLEASCDAIERSIAWLKSTSSYEPRFQVTSK